MILWEPPKSMGIHEWQFFGIFSKLTKKHNSTQIFQKLTGHQLILTKPLIFNQFQRNIRNMII